MRLGAVAVVLFAMTAHAKKPGIELARDVTVVAFGSASCKPCRAERPMLQALTRKYAGDDGVRVLVLSVDDEANAQKYAQLFGGDDLSVPRLAVLDKSGAGLERNGALASETGDGFVREVSAAIESVRSHAATPPTSMWQPLHAQP